MVIFALGKPHNLVVKNEAFEGRQTWVWSLCLHLLVVDKLLNTLELYLPQRDILRNRMKHFNCLAHSFSKIK